RSRRIGQYHRVAGSTDSVRCFLERVDRRRRAAGAIFHVIDRHAVDIVRLWQWRADLDRRQWHTLATRCGVFELALVLIKTRDQPVDQITRTGMRNVAYRRRHLDHPVALHDTQLVIAETQTIHVAATMSP